MAFVPVYILILGFTIVIDYYAGIYIEKFSGKKRKWFLVASLIANIGVLAIFKYYNFINHNLSVLMHGFGSSNPLPYLTILLPIGLSFHTFQAMSYTIEVYKGNQTAEKHFGIYALYVMFYPQLVAGPIERPQNLLHQFYEKHHFNYEQITDGLKLMAWGLFKKVVIADRLAIIVDNVYNNPYDHQGVSLIIATVLFAFQIFCDFSGYSDMAIGAAQVMGFKLMKNFDRPYHSKSIQEFWQRWHISLSTWFKDYLYISLGGNRVTIPRWYLNLFIVFMVSGLWHGANWTFIIWGAIHGFYLVFALITKNARKAVTTFLRLDKIPVVYNLMQIFIVFVLTCFAWIFFRAHSVHEALYIVKYSIVGLTNGAGLNLSRIPEDLGVSLSQIVIILASLAFLALVHYQQYHQGVRDWIKGRPFYLRWSIYYGTVLLILFFGVYEERQFIYFQF
jgi:D-alanyl-lipoteichoic acid acyltransferase DltB (MBOAT superfamily)